MAKNNTQTVLKGCGVKNEAIEHSKFHIFQPDCEQDFLKMSGPLQ